MKPRSAVLQIREILSVESGSHKNSDRRATWDLEHRKIRCVRLWTRIKCIRKHCSHFNISYRYWTDEQKCVTTNLPLPLLFPDETKQTLCVLLKQRLGKLGREPEWFMQDGCSRNDAFPVSPDETFV